MDLVKMAQSHSYYMIAFYYLKGIEKLDISTDKNIIKHFKTMFRIFCLESLMKDGSALGMNNHLTPVHFRMINELL
jgi:hypothetical protein